MLQLRGSRPLLLVLTLALVVRLAHLAAVAEAPFVASLAMDSQEYDRWAQTIAAGPWVSDQPFFQAPLYPYLLAVLYRALGRELLVVYGLQILLAVAGVYALYRAGRHLGGERWGLAAGLLAATYGPFLFYDVQLLKESLAVTVVCFLLWRLLEAGARGGTLQWAVVGGLAGVLTLLRENMLLVFPAFVVLPLTARVPLVRRASAAAALAASFALPLLPSAIHNARTGGGFLPTTFQGGVNFYIGNNPSANGSYQPLAVGKQVPYYERRESIRLAEQRLGRRLTAAQVSRFWLQEALGWARREPLAFLALQARKLALFWSWYERPDTVDYYYLRSLSPVLGLPLLEFGGVCLLALAGIWLARRRLAELAPVLLFTLLWMLATVAFFLFARYRVPVVPALLLLAALPLAELARAFEEGRKRAALGLGAVVAIAWCGPHAMGFGPRRDLVAYNLGRLYQEAGDSARAIQHYRAAVEANPRDFLSCLNLGAYAARQGRPREALVWFRRVVALEPGFDDGWADLGMAYVATDRPSEAVAALDHALSLNPANAVALHGRALLALKQGDLEQARELRRLLAEVAPDHEATQRLEARLKTAVRDERR